MTFMEEMSWDAVQLSRDIAPMLAGREPQVQGAALADLLAIWLASQPESTREDLIEMHIGAVRELIPINEALIGARSVT